MSVSRFCCSQRIGRISSVVLFVSSMAVGVYVQANGLNNVDQVFAAEAAGTPVNRREVLAGRSDEVSQWQAGRILIGGQWLDMEAIQGRNLSSQVKAYREQRDAQEELDAEGHRRMARWCQSHQLPEMAQIHWKAVISTEIDDEQARKALGHKRVGESWFTNDELKQAASEQKHEVLWLKEWMPQVRKIVNRLRSDDTATKLEGMKDLEKIDTVAAVTALKFGALQLEPSIALPIVTKIKSLRSKDACLALCEIAVCDPTSEIGRLAVEGLKEYDEHFYVPELLQMIEMPVQIRQHCIYLPNGALAIQRAYTRETANSKEQVDMLKLVAMSSSEAAVFAPKVAARDEKLTFSADGRKATLEYNQTKAYGVAVTALSPQAISSAEMLSAFAMRDEKRDAEALGQIQDQRERNAKLVLSAVSGLPADASADAYWSWWPAFNESPTNQKATSRRYLVDDSETIRLKTNGSGAVTQTTRQSTTLRVHRGSCLVAGTLVQTSDGLKSIESVEVGDEVMSVNVETGKISLRPATHVTERTADYSYVVTLADGESIRASGGHYWWVVGRGWERSRELQAGQFMRTGDSSVEIAKVEKIDTPIKVYNMIVDENHTYFVGKDRLLSWDVTSLQPTLKTVPGQVKLTYVSTK